MNNYISEAQLLPLIRMALNEDIGNGDVTSEAIFSGTEISKARIVAKADGIFCGGEVIRIVYHEIDPTIEIKQHFPDGTRVKTGDVVMTFQGPTISLLIGERTALNFAQRMSGVATRTSTIASLVDGTSISILDTRKTLPGFRMLDKYSVKMGGGKNHRIGLFDMVLIKDNHIKAAGSINDAVAKVRQRWGNKFKIEVETTTLEEVREALSANADIIMLDNIDKQTMAEAITIINKKAEIELSGNMDEEKIKNLRDLKIDYISLGALTHSVNAFDLSMKFD